MAHDIATRFRGYSVDERGAHHPPELVFEVDAPAGAAIKPMGFLERLWRLEFRKKVALAAVLGCLFAFYQVAEHTFKLLMAALSS